MNINMEKLKDLFAELERDWGNMEYTAIKKNINVGCELAREIERLKKEKACLQEEINKLRGYKNLENLDELQERYVAYLKKSRKPLIALRTDTAIVITDYVIY